MKAYKVIGRGRSLFSKDKYALSYEIDKITEALPNTVGIFCYKDLPFAIKETKFWRILKLKKEDIFLYEVEGIGEPLQNRLMCIRNSVRDLDKFYKSYDGSSITNMEAFLKWIEIGIPTPKRHVLLFNSIKVLRKIDLRRKIEC